MRRRLQLQLRLRLLIVAGAVGIMARTAISFQPVLEYSCRCGRRGHSGRELFRPVRALRAARERRSLPPELPPIEDDIAPTASITAHAACAPERMAGCGPLLAPVSSGVTHKRRILPMLPGPAGIKSLPGPISCIEEGWCPFEKFQCPRGHVWKSVPGTPSCFFCPTCAATGGRGLTEINTSRKGSRQRRTVEEIKALIAERGGECLNDDYLGMTATYNFRCGKGHSWKAALNNVLYSGSWCPHCANVSRLSTKRLSMQDMHDTAASHGGEFISDEYRGSNVPHLWRCGSGHEFWKRPNSIRRTDKKGATRKGTFCYECYRAKAETRGGRLSKRDMQAMAEKYGWLFLSEDYTGANQLHLWRCSNGHSVWLKPFQVRSWERKGKHAVCPQCQEAEASGQQFG